MPPRIAVIDANPKRRNTLLNILRREGFHAFARGTGREAVEVVSKDKPDLLIVNLFLPDMAAYDLCQKIRQTPQAQTTLLLMLASDPVEGLSARCLNSGADGFLVKPEGEEDLVAHVRAILRRPRIYYSEDTVIRRGRMTVRVGERRLIFDGKEISNLTPKEYELIREIVVRSPRVVNKHGLMLKIWGIPLEDVGRRTLDVHIQRLRSKLGTIASTCLRTTPLIGYQWLEPSKS